MFKPMNIIGTGFTWCYFLTRSVSSLEPSSLEEELSDLGIAAWSSCEEKRKKWAGFARWDLITLTRRVALPLCTSSPPCPLSLRCVSLLQQLGRIFQTVDY